MTHPVAPPGWPPAHVRGRRAILLAGGEIAPASFVRSIVTDDDLLIAANGGSRQAVAAGLVPHLLVGDLDSITRAEAASWPARTVRWQHAPDKDWSDLELALHAALAAQAREAVVIGALGGRLDHLLVNIGLLHQAHHHELPMRFVSADAEAFMVTDTVHCAWPLGRLVTVLALTPEVHGLVLEGLAWPVHGDTLQWGSSRGLSNVVASDPVRITVTGGRLLVVAGAVSTRVDVTRTYLEMRSRPDAGEEAAVERVQACPPSFYRYLYAEAGRDYHWVDRLHWTDEQILAHLETVSVYVLHQGGAPAGWFELTRSGTETEISYFGLLPGYLGRGLGRRMLNAAIARAWDDSVERVWLHTCTLDGPAALPNYRKRGFQPYKQEIYTVDLAHVVR